MPAKSKEQFIKLNILYNQGKISKKTRDEFVKGVDFSKLPDRYEGVKYKRKGK
jgi:hypothetical protein